MENEDYYEELSDKKVKLGHQEEMVGIVVPQPVNTSLEVQVVPADNIESPSPSPPTPSPVLESPHQQLGDAPALWVSFTSDDLIDLEKWVVDAPVLSRLMSGGTGDLAKFEDIYQLNMGPAMGTYIHSAVGGGPQLSIEGLPRKLHLVNKL